MFDLKLQYIATWVRDRGFTSVALQLPEGLKLRATEIVDFLTQETEANYVMLGDPCYGACDLFIDYRSVADALVHFGHSPIPSQGDDPNVLYIEADMPLDIQEKLEEVLPQLGLNIGLLATVQYLNCIPQAMDVIHESGRNAFVGDGDARIMYPGQVLGCNCTAAYSIADSVDEYLYIGEGDFHPLAAAFGAGKPIKVFNPVTGELRSVDDVRDRILRRRFAAIVGGQEAQSFLVIVCSKVGQNRNDLADKLVDMIRSKGRTAYKVFMNELSPQNLLHYRVDAYVCTACPRIAMDDALRYDRPMLTPPELEVALGIREWDDYVFDQITSQ